MGVRFRKSIKVLPGVRLNISKSGISTSVGKRGATVNFSKRGTRATVGIPGTGISYSTMVGKKRSSSQNSSSKSIRASRNAVMKEYGLTNAEMNRFEKQVKKDPKKFRTMSEEELVAYAKGEKKTSGSKTVLYVILAIILIGAIGSLSKNKQPQKGSSPKTEVSKSSSTENSFTEKPSTIPALTEKPTMEPVKVKLETAEPTKEMQVVEEFVTTDNLLRKEDIKNVSVTNQGSIKTSKADMGYQTNQSVTFVDASYLKGRGLIDITGMEPTYVNAIGFATVYSNDGLENNPDYSVLPWTVPVFSRTEKGWEQVDTIEHKSKIGIIGQELSKKNGKEYQGYLEFQEIPTGKRGYINVNNFITVPYWEFAVSESVEKGYGIATFRQRSKYNPAQKDGRPAKVKNGTQVLLPAKGTYYVSIMDRVHYQILGILFETKNNKTEPQYIFFNKNDLSIDY